MTDRTYTTYAVFGFLSLLLLASVGVFVACQAQPPTPAPVTPAAPSIVTMFDPGQAQVFMGDADVTDQFKSVGAYYRDGIVTFWAEQPSDKLSNDAGRVMLVPNEIQDRLSFGGVGSKMACYGEFENGDTSWPARVTWNANGPDGREVMELQVQGKYVTGQADRNDWPSSFHYGVVIHATCQVP